MTDPSPTPDAAPDAPVEEDEECIDPELALAFVRQHAAKRDPSRGWFYATTSAARVKEAASVAQQLLAVHHELVVRQRRGARTGRRRHAQQIADLLSATDDTTLTLAIAYLGTALGVLPRSWTQPGDSRPLAADQQPL